MSKLVRLMVVVVAIVAHAQFAMAQQTIKLLTPNSDSCAAFVEALNSDKQPSLALITLAGWATGYLSGVAQASRIDFLRPIEPGNASVFLRIEKECKQQPHELLTVVMAKIAGDMIGEYKTKH